MSRAAIAEVETELDESRDVYTATLPGQCLAEFVGTFIVILVGDGAVAAAVMTGQLDGWGVAMMWGLAVTFGIYVAGPVSGAHFNPAVTLVMAVRRELPWRNVAPYIALQLFGGLLGALAAHQMFDLPLWQYSLKARTGIGQWTGELVATFGLILTIVGTARLRPGWVPASVALYITSAYWFTSSTSFANPAITIVRSLTDSFAGIAPQDVPAFVVAQLAGALLAALVAPPLFGAPPFESVQRPG